MRLLLFLLMAGLLPGCVAVNEPFDADEAAYINRKGTAVVAGEAFMRRDNGYLASGAGMDVHLVPVTRYSEARFKAIFGNRKQVPLMLVGAPPKGYVENQRETKVDRQGRFAFEGVPAGSYFVMTRIEWNDRYDGPQGGVIYDRVTVKDGEVANVILSGH